VPWPTTKNVVIKLITCR